MSVNYTHAIKLTAQDAISPVFIKVAAAAKTAAAEVTAGGAKATAALDRESAAASKTGTQIQTLGTRLEEFNKRNAAIGAGIATLVGGLSTAVRAYQEEVAGLDRLATAVENTGASYDAYSAKIDLAVAKAQQLAFADDEAVNALNTLTAATQDTGRALQLLSVAQDLARGKNISLASASEIVGKVAAGNLTILGRYGIVLEKNATSTEALAAISQRFGGQAGTFADSAAGSAQRFQHELDNAIETIGGATGEFQGLLAVLPGVTAGWQLLGGAIGGVAKQGLPTLLTGATRVVGLLNPLTLGVTAAAAAGVLLTKAVLDYRAAVEAAADPTDTLTNSILRLDEALGDAAGQALLGHVVTGWEAVSAAAKQAEADQLAAADALASAPVIGGLGQSEEMAQQALANAQALEQQRDAAARAAITAQGLAAIEADLGTIMGQTGDELRNDLAAVNDRFAAYRTGTISGQELVEALEGIAAVDETARKALEGIGDTAGIAAPEVDGLARSVTDAYAAINSAGLSTTVFSDLRAEVRETLDTLERARLNEALQNLGTGFEGNTSPIAAKQDALRVESSRAAEAARVQAKADAEAEMARLGEEAVREAQQAAEARAEAEERLNTQLVAATRDRLKGQREAERAYQQDVRALQAERVDQERALSQELRGIEEERRNVAADTEQQLADLAEQRTEVQRDAAASMADAERQWVAAQRETARAQGQIQAELRRTTADAKREWQQLNAENAAQVRQIKQDLQDAQRDLQTNFGRDLEDNEIRRVRVVEDLQIALSDPNATDAQKQEAQLQANRELADLARERQRLEEDFNREQQQAREAARQQEKAAAEEKKRGQQEYREAVKAAQAEANQQLAANRKAQDQAHADFLADQRDTQQATLAALGDLDEQQREIMAEQATRFRSLEADKRSILRDGAIDARTLARDTAQLERQQIHEVQLAQREADQEARQAQREYQQALRELPERATTNLIADDKTARPKLTGVQNQLADIRSGAEAEITVVVKQQERATSSIDKAAKPRNVEQTETKTTVSRSINEQVVQITADTSGFEKGLARATALGTGWTQHAQYLATLLLQREAFDLGLRAAEADGAAFAQNVYTAGLKLDVGLGGASGGSGTRKGNFYGNLEGATGAGERWAANVWEAAIDLETTKFDAGLVNAAIDGDRARRDFAAQAWVATLLAQRRDFDAILAAATADGETFGKGVFTAQLAADSAPFVKTGSEAHQKGLAFAKTAYTADLLADAQLFNTTVNNALSRLKTVNAAKATVQVNANTSQFWNTIRDLDGDTVATTYINVRARNQTGIDDAFALGGSIQSRVPAAAMGRVVQVGEAGPEPVLLPYGAQVLPHGAAPADARPPAGLTFNGPVYFQMANADVAKEVNRQLRQRGIAS